MKPAPNPASAPARPFRRRLAYHLIVVLAVKLILLALLWHTFIRPNKVTVDIGVMGERIAGVSSGISLPISPGENK
jgi:hypothetical protein